jgi:hypothetical protein
MSGAERVLHAWRSSEEVWRLRGRAFAAADVRFLIVGGYALALHGRPRATAIWTSGSRHRQRTRATSWLPLRRSARRWATFLLPISRAQAFQIGVAPGRIDILTDLTGLTFDATWSDRMSLSACAPR